MISRLIIGFLAGIALLAFAAPASAEEYPYTTQQLKGIAYLAKTYHRYLVSSNLAIDRYGITDCVPEWSVDEQPIRRNTGSLSFFVKEQRSMVRFSFGETWCAKQVTDTSRQVGPGEVLYRDYVIRFDQLPLREVCSILNTPKPHWHPDLTDLSCTSGPLVYRTPIYLDPVTGKGAWVYGRSPGPGSVLAFQPELPPDADEPIGLIPGVE